MHFRLEFTKDNHDLTQETMARLTARDEIPTSFELCQTCDFTTLKEALASAEVGASCPK